jgi:hypothetical protein
LPNGFDFLTQLFDVGLVLLHVMDQCEQLLTEIDDIFEHRSDRLPQSGQYSPRLHSEYIRFYLEIVNGRLILFH